MDYATDGKCHNAQPGTYGHECGKPDTGPGPSCLIFGPARVKLVERPSTYHHCGRDFTIVAEYPDTDEGTAKANAFMTENPETGPLAVDAGRIIIAALNDKGVNP